MGRDELDNGLLGYIGLIKGLEKDGSRLRRDSDVRIQKPRRV